MGKSSKGKKVLNVKKPWFLIPIIIIILLVIVFLARTKMKKDNPDAHIATTARDLFDFEANYKDRKVVVAYFSVTGKTKTVAEKIAKVFDCDAIPIEPLVPYTAEDINNDINSRAQKEARYDPFDPPEEPEEDEEVVVDGEVKSLPPIKKVSFNRYDTIFLGYPIWYGDAPRVIYTFISETDLKNKVIIPFCTSDNDGIAPSDQDLANFASDSANFMSGKRFTVDSTEEEIKNFVTMIGVDVDAWD